MNPKPGAWYVLFLLLVFVAAAPTHAHYDDVHYALTYYLARQVGYTPTQAYRIAKANLSVDYAYPTEPVQASSTYAAAKALMATESAQEPRWRFHAFRNEYKFPGVTDSNVGAGDPLAVQADADINGQRVALWTQAIEDGNPGVFLHFLQDQVPHARFGSAYGHWPIVRQQDIDNAQAHGLPLGGSTDWLSFRDEASNLVMVRSSFDALALYMKKVSPHQHSRNFDANEFAEVLRELRQVNPAPAPLADKLLAMFTELRTDMATRGGVWDLINNYANKHQLNAAQTRDASAHQFGPDLPRAMTVINAAMKRQGLSIYGSWETPETLPAPPSSDAAGYAFDAAGRLPDRDQLDGFVLTGTLNVIVERADANTSTAAGNVQVTVLLAKTRAQLEEREAPIAGPRTVPIGGEPVTFARVPIGGLIIEVTSAGQPPVRTPFSLEAQSDTVSVTLPALTEPLRSSAVPDDVAKEESRLTELLATLRGQRDQAAQQFEAALAAVQSQLAQRDATHAPATGTTPTTTALAGTTALCARIDDASQRLATTLRKLEVEQTQLESILQQAQQRATRCADLTDAAAAESGVQQAQALATGIDQQASALALLALQVDELAQQRQQLLQQLLQQRAARSTAVGQAGTAITAIDFSALNAALAALRAFDRIWSVAEAARERPGLARIKASIDNITPSQQPTQRAVLARMQRLLDEIAVLGREPHELQQAQGRVAALAARAKVNAGTVNNNGNNNGNNNASTDDARFTDAPETTTATCLDRQPPDIGQGMAQADTTRALAQLAMTKLGGATQTQLQLCRQQIAARPLDPTAAAAAAVAAKTCRYEGSEAYWDEKEQRAMCRCPVGKQWNSDRSGCVTLDKTAAIAAAVAAKTCSYEGSEAYWDEKERRAMCRCPTGRQWNSDRSACIADRQTQLANANCSRYANTEPRWREDQNKVVCSCRDGYQVALGREACVPDQATQLAQQRCTAAYTEPYWDEQSQTAGCRCQNGYAYSEIFQQCEIDWRAEVSAKDCSRYGNAEAYWDYERNRAACRCAAGYQRDPASNRCKADIETQLADTDCSRWPNSEPRWDFERDDVQCQCIAGYRYNSRRQACERDIDELLANTDCSRWPNSEPVWDRDDQKVNCECIAGTRYNRDAERCERERTASEQVAALNCSAYANSEAYWDQDENRPMCRCRTGYQAAQYSVGCEAKPVVIDCNTASEAGANPPETITVNIGTHVGMAQFHYEMFDVHDRMVIEYGGRTIADTGCINGSGNLNLDLIGRSNQVIIQVLPNCRGSTNTEWKFTLSCPQ